MRDNKQRDKIIKEPNINTVVPSDAINFTQIISKTVNANQYLDVKRLKGIFTTAEGNNFDIKLEITEDGTNWSEIDIDIVVKQNWNFGQIGKLNGRGFRIFARQSSGIEKTVIMSLDYIIWTA